MGTNNIPLSLHDWCDRYKQGFDNQLVTLNDLISDHW